MRPSLHPDCAPLSPLPGAGHHSRPRLLEPAVAAVHLPHGRSVGGGGAPRDPLLRVRQPRACQAGRDGPAGASGALDHAAAGGDACRVDAPQDLWRVRGA
eukprot:5870625-Prymnesium_polylepis.2